MCSSVANCAKSRRVTLLGFVARSNASKCPRPVPTHSAVRGDKRQWTAEMAERKAIKQVPTKKGTSRATVSGSRGTLQMVSALTREATVALTPSSAAAVLHNKHSNWNVWTLDSGAMEQFIPGHDWPV